MKKLFLAVLSLALFASCETEINETTATNETVDLRLMTPKASFNNEQSGMYAGVIAGIENGFHGKLWVNMNNDRNTTAMIETAQGDVHYIALVGQVNGIYQFEGAIGSFDFNPADFNDTQITNVVMNGGNGAARVLKETSQTRMTPVLGTYDNFFGGNYGGTWNFIAQDQAGSPFNVIQEIVITSSNPEVTNNMIIDNTLEPGLPGCYNFGGPVPPVFANYPNTPDDPDGTLRDFAVYAVNQLLPISAPNKNIVYDVGFSQRLTDNFGIVGYDRLLGNPQGTAEFLLGFVITDGCYNFDPTATGIPGANSQGYYAVKNDEGDFTGEGGRIYITEVANLIQVTGIQGSNPSEDRNNSLEPFSAVNAKF